MTPRMLLMQTVLLLFSVQPCQAQRLSDSDRCVDKVFLREGIKLYGAVLGRAEDGTLSMAVQREWLRAKSKRFYEQQTGSEDPVKRLETLRDRIVNWQQEVARQKNLPGRELSDPLERYLREELESVNRQLADAKQNPHLPDSQFVLLEIPAKDIQRGFMQPTEQRQLALAAWHLQLENVEERSADDLTAELRERKVDPANLEVDLSERLPKRTDSEREWAARRAIVEHQFAMSLEFQGTRDFLFETGRERPDITALLPKLLTQELTRQLEELLGEAGGGGARKSDPIAEATKTADQNQLSAIVITRLDQQLKEKTVAVETIFLAKMPGGEWKAVWTNIVNEDASQPRKEIEAELADHEQIKQIQAAFKAISLPGAEDQLTLALRFGAATMQAQQKPKRAFDEFVKRYVETLDGPPLLLGSK